MIKDTKRNENTKHERRKDRAILVGLQLNDGSSFEHNLEELESLCQACDIAPVFTITQSLDAPHQALYIGSGKVHEVKEAATNLDADLIIFDNALSPSQARNLNLEIGLPILDRTALILEIFQSRARSREAKLQVELARLNIFCLVYPVWEPPCQGRAAAVDHAPTRVPGRRNWNWIADISVTALLSVKELQTIKSKG